MRFLIILCFPLFVHAQSVVTAFPSLEIPGPGRGLSMGNSGIASAQGNQQPGYNAAKSAFIQNFHQLSFGYTPWLSSLSNDMRFMQVGYLANVFNTSALGLSVNYLDMGTITTKDNNGASIASYRASEFHGDGSYAVQIANKASLGVSMKFLHQTQFSDVPKNVSSLCGDISFYQFVNISGDANKKIEWGLVVNNLGANINLPTSVGMGIGYTSIDADDGMAFTASFDIKSLLRPRVVSAFDLRNLIISSGLELGFLNQFFLRGGINLENQHNGNRKFFSLGVGYQDAIKDQGWGIDFHYLVPFGSVTGVSPFQNALGLGLQINMGNFQ